jgi:universal stress protein A
MPAVKAYLVPIDFSAGSAAALRHAVAMTRKSELNLYLLHVVPLTLVFPAERRYFEILEQRARAEMGKLARRVKLEPSRLRFDVIRSGDIARAIADRASAMRASLIVMGSHGRSGLSRLMLGSVAERTLRYAECPVLVVKR